MKTLDEIDAIVAEIERLDAALGGKARQIEDREAGDIVHRILIRHKTRKQAGEHKVKINSNAAG